MNQRNVQAAWQFLHPFLRQYSPQLFEVGRRIVGSQYLPVALGVASNLYTGTKRGAEIAKLYGNDYTYEPKQSEEPPAKRPRLFESIRPEFSAATNHQPNSNSNAGSAANNQQVSLSQGRTHGHIALVQRMAYPRRYKISPGIVSRRYYRGGWSSQPALRRKFFRGRRWYNKPELKSWERFIDTNVPTITFWRGFTEAQGSSGAATNGNAVLVNGMNQGAGVFNRIGSQVTVKKIYIQYCIVRQTTIAQTTPQLFPSSCMRVVLIKDRQPNGAAPAITDIFDSSVTSAFSTEQPLNLTYRNRFKILAERRYILTAGSEAQMYYGDIIYKKPFRVTYTGSTDGIAAIRTNSVYIIFLSHHSSLGDANTNPSVVSFSSRCRFVDP